MTELTDSLLDDLRQRRTHIARKLQSGVAGHVEEALQLIDLYQHHALDLTSLDLVRRTKLWLTQPRDRPDAKDRFFMETLWQDAQDAQMHALRDWRIVGRCAHVAFYAEEIETAWTWFGEAFDEFEAESGGRGIPGLTDPIDQALASDMFAGRAEFRIYLGYPEMAEQDIAAIPDPKAWHLWVRAFALHMLGFAERVPFGDPPGNPPHKPGEETRYLQSNQQIDDVLAMADQDRKLPDQDRYDIELLRAANWGAISRRRGREDDGAKANAEAALKAFKSARPPSSNIEWTWQKERRGPLPDDNYEFDDENLSPAAVQRWRRAYRDCYVRNLRQAGLAQGVPPGTPRDLRDGWTP